jgi:hypothetical protein
MEGTRRTLMVASHDQMDRNFDSDREQLKAQLRKGDCQVCEAEEYAEGSDDIDWDPAWTKEQGEETYHNLQRINADAYTLKFLLKALVGFI